MIRGSYIILLLTFLISSPLFAQEDLLTSNTITNSLHELKLTFEAVGFAGMSSTLDIGFGMRIALPRHEREIKQMLDAMLASEEIFKAGTDYMFAAYNRHIEIFGPPKDITKEILEKYAPKSVLLKESLTAGFDIYAYLLLELTKKKQSPAFTRKTLSTLYDAYRSLCYKILWQVLYDSADKEWLDIEMTKEQIKRMKEAKVTFSGGTYSDAISWACDKFMSDLYLSEQKFLSLEALRVIQNYANWKKGRALRRQKEPHRVMQYVAELIEILPKK